MSLIDRVQHLYVHELWERDLGMVPRLQRALVYSLRMIWVMGRDLYDGQLNLRAMSLVYTTLLSIVPLLALSFSVLKAFGVSNQIQPLLLNCWSHSAQRASSWPVRSSPSSRT